MMLSFTAEWARSDDPHIASIDIRLSLSILTVLFSSEPETPRSMDTSNEPRQNNLALDFSCAKQLL